MYQYNCLNPISEIGLSKFTDSYQKTEDLSQADGVLVRSASMHEMELRIIFLQLQERERV